jgi:DnaK suppressor protein
MLYYSQLEREQKDIAQKIQQVKQDNLANDSVNRQMLHTWQAQLNKVREALARCVSGEYGICVSCHQAIDAERLIVVPSADRCVQCQRQQEKRQNGYDAHHRPNGRI